MLQYIMLQENVVQVSDIAHVPLANDESTYKI